MLCRRYIAQKCNDYEMSEIRLSKLDIKPFNEQMLQNRINDLQNGEIDKEEYRLAKQFAEADVIVVGAPYWDAAFPSILKVYIEHICVNSITFSYGDDGGIVKLCNANRLVYITTAGGYMREHSGVQIFVEELCEMFGIKDMKFYCAQGLDIYPQKADSILEDTFHKIMMD